MALNFELNKLDNKSDNYYIFIDFSNITIGFYNHIINNYKKYKIVNPKINYDVLLSIIEKDKNVKRRVLIGSQKNTKKNRNDKNNKKIFDKYGYEVYMLERVNNKEKGVDEILHGKIMETILYTDIPGCIVICSGDGKTSDYTENSFYKLCIKALKIGWKVIIISWKKQISKNYILGPELYNLLKNDDIKNNYNILYLDNYVEKIID